MQTLCIVKPQLFVRLSVVRKAYLSGTGLPGRAVLVAAALLSHTDHGCPGCLLSRDKLNPS